MLAGKHIYNMFTVWQINRNPDSFRKGIAIINHQCNQIISLTVHWTYHKHGHFRRDL